jgi:excisionase family DNA binding protein
MVIMVESGLLTLQEAARRVGVTRATVRGWITSGKLPARREGRRYVVQPIDLLTAQEVAHVDGVVPAWRRQRRRAGSRLRSLRQAAGLTQLDLAAASGLTHEAISILELGHRAPQAESVRKLARALQVEPVRFVGREQIPPVGLTVPEAAARLGVPSGRVRVWLAEGQLAGTKVSGVWRVPAAAVRELVRSGRMRGRSRRLDPRYRG